MMNIPDELWLGLASLIGVIAGHLATAYYWRSLTRRTERDAWTQARRFYTHSRRP